MLFERRKHIIEAYGEAAAMVRNLDQDSICCSVRAQSHFGAGLREFESVLQQVADCGQKHFPVDIERKCRVDDTGGK